MQDVAYIKLGRNRTIEGKAMRIIMTIRSQTRNGAAAKHISPSLVPGGADPFITKRRMPKGGVDMAISRLRSMRIANQIGLNPRL